jgi:hypothetical protein
LRSQFRLFERKGRLAEVTKEEARIAEAVPREADRCPAEVPEISIKRLSASHDEEYSADDEKALPPTLNEDAYCMGRICCP